jgi:hypothetical protein
MGIILSSLLLFIVPAIITSVSSHILSNNTKGIDQEWINQLDNVKIQFTYEPERPILYSLTDLKFSVQDLKTGKHLKDLIASITVNKDQKIFFKFNNITIQNGDFSLKLRFLEEGNYQVISKIDSRKDNIAIALASFNVFVPLQPFGTINIDYLTPLLLPAGLVAIIGIIVTVAFIIIIKREK